MQAGTANSSSIFLHSRLRKLWFSACLPAVLKGCRNRCYTDCEAYNREVLGLIGSATSLLRLVHLNVTLSTSHTTTTTPAGVALSAVRGQPMSETLHTSAAVAIDVAEDQGEDGNETPAGSGMQITFRNMAYKVQNKQNTKEQITILHGLSGFFNPSQMTAVMGPRCGAIQAQFLPTTCKAIHLSMSIHSSQHYTAHATSPLYT